MKNSVDIIEYMPMPFSNFEMTIVVLLFLISIFFVYRLIKKYLNRPQNLKKYLKSLDISKKENLFIFTNIAQKIDNSQRLKELLLEIEEYKYSPTPKPIPDDLQNRIKEYISDVAK